MSAFHHAFQRAQYLKSIQRKDDRLSRAIVMAKAQLKHFRKVLDSAHPDFNDFIQKQAAHISLMIRMHKLTQEITHLTESQSQVAKAFIEQCEHRQIVSNFASSALLQPFDAHLAGQKDQWLVAISRPNTDEAERIMLATPIELGEQVLDPIEKAKLAQAPFIEELKSKVTQNRPSLVPAIEQRIQSDLNSLKAGQSNRHAPVLSADALATQIDTKTENWRQHALLAAGVRNAAQRLKDKWFGGSKTRKELEALAEQIENCIATGAPLTRDSYRRFADNYAKISAMHQHRTPRIFRSENKQTQTHIDSAILLNACRTVLSTAAYQATGRAHVNSVMTPIFEQLLAPAEKAKRQLYRLAMINLISGIRNNARRLDKGNTTRSKLMELADQLERDNLNLGTPVQRTNIIQGLDDYVLATGGHKHRHFFRDEAEDTQTHDNAIKQSQEIQKQLVAKEREINAKYGSSRPDSRSVTPLIATPLSAVSTPFANSPAGEGRTYSPPPLSKRPGPHAIQPTTQHSDHSLPVPVALG